MKNCNYCGSKLDDSATFCSTCGKLVNDSQDNTTQQSTTEYVNPITEDKKSSLGRKILMDSIIGLALGIIALIIHTSFCSVFLMVDMFKDALCVMIISIPVNIVGTCFSRSARAKLKKYKSMYGQTSGPASVGNGLSIPANIINIVLLAFQAFMFVFACVMMNI